MSYQAELRTFLLCDDASENFFVGRIRRYQHEVKPELWALEVGDTLQSSTDSGSCWMRES